MPVWRKFNPGNSPAAVLTLTSKTRTRGQLYDAAATVLAQKLSQVDGVGQVDIRGSSLPAVRVQLNALALFNYGLGLEDVRAALAAANANSPKGAIEFSGRRLQLYSVDQARQASDYRDLVIAWRNGAPLRLKDVAEVTDDVEDPRNQGADRRRAGGGAQRAAVAGCEHHRGRRPHQRADAGTRRRRFRPTSTRSWRSSGPGRSGRR